MMKKKPIIQNFGHFEKVYESHMTGGEPLDEGIFSGIKNFFSGLFGGKVSDLDSIITKYNVQFCFPDNMQNQKITNLLYKKVSY